MSDRDESGRDDDEGFDTSSDRDDEFDESDLGDDNANPLADLSPFAEGDEGTNLDDDSDYELEDTEYQDDADRVYSELLARIGESAPQPRLEATRRAVELLGDPQNTYPIVHIAGTNGKTSTSRITESILRAYGLRTGLLTSPHLRRVNERIVIDGHPISNRALAANWEDIRPFIDMVDAELIANSEEPLTFFEALTVLAYASFADAPVDVAVIEVGMGGEWDSTNVADGQVAVFTPIALDHTQRLGSTIAEIARTKSGIIKPLANVVSASQTTDALSELERAVELTEATFAVEGTGFELLGSNVAVGGQVISVKGLAGTYTDLFLPMFGDHQGHNAALAIAAVESFLGAGSQALVGDVLAEGLATATSPGRLQIIGTEPTVHRGCRTQPARGERPGRRHRHVLHVRRGRRRAQRARRQGCARNHHRPRPCRHSHPRDAVPVGSCHRLRRACRTRPRQHRRRRDVRLRQLRTGDAGCPRLGRPSAAPRRRGHRLDHSRRRGDRARSSREVEAVTDANQPAPRIRRARSTTETLLSIVLVLEAVLLFFVTLTVFGLKALPPVPAFVGGGLLIVALILAGRLLRYPWGIWVGWALQAVLIATGIVLTAMYFIALAFVAIWVYCFVKGRQIDQQRAELENPTST